MTRRADERHRRPSGQFQWGRIGAVVMIGPAPQCWGCKHFDYEDEGMKCKAFPDGIPEVIQQGDYDHREPYKGDHGITYESHEPYELCEPED